MVRLKCNSCNWEWNYKGKNNDKKRYITCPYCYNKNQIGKATENYENKNTNTHSSKIRTEN